MSVFFILYCKFWINNNTFKWINFGNLKKIRENVPGNFFDGIMPGSVVAVAINNVRFKRKKNDAVSVQWA